MFLGVIQKKENVTLLHLVNNLVKIILLSLAIVPDLNSSQALVLDVFILITMFCYNSRCSMTGCFSQWLQLHQLPTTRIFSLQCLLLRSLILYHQN